MPDFYYGIKSQSQSGSSFFGPWECHPKFAGKVTAGSKAEAKALIEEEYGRKFPLRVLQKDLSEQPFLLRIDELKPGDYRWAWFAEITCKCCTNVFTMIDKYNDPVLKDTSRDYCSAACHKIGRHDEISALALTMDGAHPPVIYRIQQLSTGRCYVGQTTKAFTYRWWQHVAYPSDSKFHKAFKESGDLTDWSFNVLETVGLPPAGVTAIAYITDRERHWIDVYDSVENGFNTVKPSRLNPQQALEL